MTTRNSTSQCVTEGVPPHLVHRIQHFKECISFIHECRLSGGSCLVHCLAGVSRSTTVVVAYLMTVTSYSWEECLSAVKAVRSFVGPNFGFQQQLQEFQMTLVPEFRSWLRAKYSHSPSDDQEGVRKLLGLYEEQQQQQRQRNGEQSWMNQAASVYPLPYNAYRRSGHRNPHFCAGSLVLVQPSLYCGVDHSLEGLVPYPTVQHSAAQGSKCD
nr:PREDICTED: dual specificity protein phosphatase 22-A-like isoform X3 [Lepisosteus oculatus]